MCLLLFAFQTHPEYPLVVAANRDEFHRRPAAPAAWWAEQNILAGRDLQAGGSWLGVNRRGRFAAVTNYREPDSRRPDARSRGDLIVETLKAERAGSEWLQALAAEGQLYNGFNLIFGDSASLYSYSNRSEQPSELKPGLYGLSNHLLETPWPKVRRGKALLTAYMESPQLGAAEPLLDLLADRTPAQEQDLPVTGLEPDWERLLSPMFIVSPDYGTRASTAVLVHHSGAMTFMERGFDVNGEPLGEQRFQFQIDQA